MTLLHITTTVTLVKAELSFNKILNGYVHDLDCVQLGWSLPQLRARLYYEAAARGLIVQTKKLPRTLVLRVKAMKPEVHVVDPDTYIPDDETWRDEPIFKNPQVPYVAPAVASTDGDLEFVQRTSVHVSTDQGDVTVSYDLDDYDATCTCGQAPTCLPACFNAGQTDENRRLLAEKQLRAQGVTPPAPPSAPPGAEDLGVDPAPIAPWAKERNAQLMADGS